MHPQQLLKAVSDRTRIEILRFLLTGSKNASQIVAHVKKSQPNTSLALKQLFLVGLVDQEKRGREVYYKLRRPEKVRQLLEVAEELSR